MTYPFWQPRLLIVAAVLSLTLCNQPVLAKELRLAHFMPPVHTLHEKVFAPLAEQLARESGGELTLTIHPAGALGKGPVQQYKRAVEGVADITFCIHSYTAELFPLSQLMTLPGIYKDAVEGTDKLWQAFAPHLQGEYQDIKLLGLWAMSPTVLITRDKQVEKVADMGGMKVRTGSPGEAEAVQAWGGVPVTMPITESYNALNTGIVDAVLIQASAIYQPWNLAEPGKYVTDLLPSPSTIVMLAMNKDSWKGLSDKHQAILDKLTGREFSRRAAAVWAEADVAALKKADSDSEIKRIALSPEEQVAFAAAVAPMIENELAKLATKGVDGGAVFKAIKP